MIELNLDLFRLSRQWLAPWILEQMMDNRVGMSPIPTRSIFLAKVKTRFLLRPVSKKFINWTRW
jgi:hypothetical protein